MYCFPFRFLYRIGQKKPVQVFCFITDGTVEEKTIERADRKLFLDAAVIQQGRLAAQNSSLEKGELMKMIRFGADQILSG
jgi:SWI/SNF-related matrix-associated actin-dependent regulator of chromatin subfamily A member 5